MFTARCPFGHIELVPSFESGFTLGATRGARMGSPSESTSCFWTSSFHDQRGTMQRVFFGVLVIALSMNAAAFGQSGQSLGDIARANREKQEADEAAGKMPRVITNKDLPTDSTGIPDPQSSEPMTTVSGVTRFDDRFSDRRYNDRVFNDRVFNDQRSADERAGTEWRARIQAQQNRIADLQARIDQMNAWIHSAGGSVQSEGAYNRAQAFQMQRLAQMQSVLDQQRRTLYMMQDAARRAGMHTQVYDP